MRKPLRGLRDNKVLTKTDIENLFKKLIKELLEKEINRS